MRSLILSQKNIEYADNDEEEEEDDDDDDSENSEEVRARPRCLTDS